MHTSIEKDRRQFRRYSREHSFDLFYEDNIFRATINDYSLTGICLRIDNAPALKKGDLLDILIPDPQIMASGHIIWLISEGRSLRLGLKYENGVRGHIKDFRFADVLIGLQRSQKTGILTVEVGDKIKKLFIQNGTAIFSASNRPEDRLGDLLLREGRITLEQYNHSIEELKKTKQRLGEILLRLGYLHFDELVPAVKRQVEEIILGIFELDNGRFYFREAPLPTEEIITLRLSAATLIYRGIQRIQSFNFIRQDMPFLDRILRFSTNPLDLFQDVHADAAARKLIACIDGKKSIYEVMNSSGLHELNAIKIVYALLNIRFLEASDRTALQEYDEELPEEIREEIIEEIPESVGDSQLREMIEDMHVRYKNLGYYDMLNIGKHASPAEIRKAYYAAAKKFHPDRHFRFADESMRSKLSNIFSYVHEAYSALSDPQKKIKHDSLSSSSPLQPAMPQDKARTIFTKGKAAFNKNNLEEAELFFAQAIYFDSTRAEFHYYHAMSQNKRKKLKEAAKSLENALKLEPSSALYITELGSVFLKLGLPTRAKGLFEKALTISPDYSPALEGIKDCRNYT